MTDITVVTIVTEAIAFAAKIMAPALLGTLVVGVVVSLLQTITQIQEQTLTFVPKLMTMGLILVVGGHWLLTEVTTYVTDLWSGIPAMF